MKDEMIDVLRGYLVALKALYDSGIDIPEEARDNIGDGLRQFLVLLGREKIPPKQQENVRRLKESIKTIIDDM